jgi:hypothetical protein
MRIDITAIDKHIINKNKQLRPLDGAAAFMKLHFFVRGKGRRVIETVTLLVSILLFYYSTRQRIFQEPSRNLFIPSLFFGEST